MKELNLNVENTKILGKYKDPNEFLGADRDNFIKALNELEINKVMTMKVDKLYSYDLENKKLIEKKLGNQVKFFCWPWGHRSKETIKIIKELGVVGFISTKKGTNSMKANWDMIRRIELRRYTPKKFKIKNISQYNLPTFA